LRIRPIELGLARLIESARANGVAGLAVFNSYNCGVVGHHAEHLAQNGLVALVFVNAPRAIAPWGGNRALYGTNPIAFACPRQSGNPLVIDQSSSVVARGEIMLRASQGKSHTRGLGRRRSGKADDRSQSRARRRQPDARRRLQRRRPRAHRRDHGGGARRRAVRFRSVVVR
jgi:(2R)-3-sulfolactate dehydrogenase (NADP+)